MIEALLLDLDNTLIDRDAAWLAWLEETLPAHAQTAENVDALRTLDRGGRGPKSAFFSRVSEIAHVSPRVVRRRFFEELPRFVRLKPDADALLRSFRGVTVLVTNGPSVLQRAKIAAAGLVDRLDHVLVSEEQGLRKPQAVIFEKALALAGCAAEDAMMIGDDPRTDIAGARAAGIAAVLVRTRWFDAPADVRSVHALTELTW
jgi:putative hydrolase of the HAD superfamily